MLQAEEISAADESGIAQSEPTTLPKMLLLNSGRLVEGSISQSATGYIVEKENGTMLIPFSQVKLTAQNRNAIYQKLRREMPADTVENHLTLARWCLSHKLYDQSRAELEQTLKQAPHEPAARKMLVRLNAILKPKKNRSSQQEPVKQVSHSEVFLIQDVQSLAGLTREQASLFTRRVQPILINKCGNANCHSSASPSKFQLVMVRPGRGSHRIFAEKNLAAVLNYINHKETADSKLLLQAARIHGNARRPIFVGKTGSKQLQILKDWVNSVAQEESNTKSQRIGQPDRITRNDQSQSFSNRYILQNKTRNKIKKSSKTDNNQKNGEKSLADPFDPVEFNRQP